MPTKHSADQGNYKPIVIGGTIPDENWPYPAHPDNPNSRYFGNEAPKFERHIYIRKDQLLYDIEAQLLVVARARRRQDGSEDENISTASDTFRGLFERWMGKYLGIAEGVMAAFVLQPFDTQLFNAIPADKEWDIELWVPEFWDDTVFQQLVNAIHDYIVNGCLYEYFLLNYTSKDPLTIDKKQLMDTALVDVKHYIHAAKPGRIRKVLQPF